ncbi:hypothetical protein AU192_04110 [Mycobacterium lehmannii]|uniref:Uncharacterized protein n=1 Tax=Mycobacterium lehmannii TaxID=2048550 RepID=A0A117JJ33_9MYCO|nr:hypothetical protein [Mycobacterium lehmannii]KUI13597.1 hypothetical protein AU192_04110 [Mycobacterium lehmannii]
MDFESYGYLGGGSRLPVPLTVAMPVGSLVTDPTDPGVLGVVVEHPAVDPDGDVWPQLMNVLWLDLGYELIAAQVLRTAVPL